MGENYRQPINIYKRRKQPYTLTHSHTDDVAEWHTSAKSFTRSFSHFHANFSCSSRFSPPLPYRYIRLVFNCIFMCSNKETYVFLITNTLWMLACRMWHAILCLSKPFFWGEIFGGGAVTTEISIQFNQNCHFTCINSININVLPLLLKT